ncbi:hypothetical protein [Chromatium okenii]|uniref:hypothetical protein n=1 Tax=Chromatium okenii TaxID=61644 RepID=UPI001F5B1986|nr:hypothetical protein [Chromatium okenii]
MGTRFKCDVQRAIGRVQSLDMVRDVFLTARETGFHSINLDLVYGLPFQTRQGFQSTLQHILALSPDRVACFSYTHDPRRARINTPLTPIIAQRCGKVGAISRCSSCLYRGWLSLGWLDVFVRETDELANAKPKGDCITTRLVTPAAE